MSRVGTRFRLSTVFNRRRSVLERAADCGSVAILIEVPVDVSSRNPANLSSGRRQLTANRKDVRLITSRSFEHAIVDYCE
jgi:hypothetical protein